jgi:hypothetical protein
MSMLFFVLVLVMVMAVQRIEGAEDWGLVGNWELWRRGGQRTDVTTTIER